jgi:hypothetical protein
MGTGALHQSLKDLLPIQGLQPDLLPSAPSPTTWRRTLEMLIVTQTVRKYPAFYVHHYCTLLYSQYSEHNQSSLHSQPISQNLPPVVTFCKCCLSSDILQQLCTNFSCPLCALDVTPTSFSLIRAPNNILGRTQIMKPIIIYSPPFTSVYYHCQKSIRILH